MPELILKFNLPEEQNEADITTNALGMFSAIHSFKEDMRRKLKHNTYSEAEQKALEDISDLFYEKLDEYNIIKLF